MILFKFKSIPFISLFFCLTLLSMSVSAEVININKADASAFQLLKGVGEVKAKTIVLYRKKHGTFKSINDLTGVKGIGEKIIKKNKGQLSLTKGIVTAPKIAKSKTDKKSTKATKAKKKEKTPKTTK